MSNMTRRQVTRLAKKAQRLGEIKSILAIRDGKSTHITANVSGTPDEIASRVMSILKGVK